MKAIPIVRRSSVQIAVARLSFLLFAASPFLGACTSTIATRQHATSLLNVSYDPTREFYDEYNIAFAKRWKAKTGETVSISQSHGASGKQSQSVIQGLDADVVTLGLAYDIDAIAQAGLIQPEWQARLPNHSSPYTSTIVFLVRKGNPKHIRDWDDLIKPNVQIITPNPKSSGAARWAYLAAWGFAFERYHSNVAAREFVTALLRNVPVLDSGSRAATITFAQRKIGDVLLDWENEAYLAQNKLGKGEFQVVVPSTSILAEPPVSVVDSVAKNRGTTELATAYLRYLYSDEAQRIIAKHYYRPRNLKAAGIYATQFKKLQLFTIDLFGGWGRAQQDHFADGGIFDHIIRSIR